jgi:hypothetical protein
VKKIIPSCRRDQIINPSTNRCVLRSGKTARVHFSDKAKVPTKGDITVRVGEVYTGSFMENFVELHLTPAFFKIVTKRPRVLRNKEGNAYVFGPLFRRPAYQFMGNTKYVVVLWISKFYFDWTSFPNKIKFKNE